jgi:RNAse (barnase) inhibitor barstar
MAVFDELDPERPNRLDWKILRDGAISLYFDSNALEEACAWFCEHNYHLYMFDCTQWRTQKDFYDAAITILHLPDYCGDNLDSIKDCLWSMEVPQEGGAAIIFSRFDILWQQWPIFSSNLLDVLEEQSRGFLLFGRRLIVLIQSDYPDISFQTTKIRHIALNPAEQLMRTREVLKKTQQSTK